MEKHKEESSNQSFKNPNKGINPVLNDIISILFLPAGLFLMLINSSMPKAYKTVIVTSIIIGAIWVIYSILMCV